MPNPKRRHSNTRTALRRAHDFLKPGSLSTCAHCKAQIMPHRICPKCGYYKGRQARIIKVEGKEKE